MPPTSEAKQVEARQKQSKADKRATLQQLLAKPPSTTEFSIYLTDGNGGSSEVTLKYRAIGMVAYDKLVSKHPPKKDQMVEGASFDIDTFAPALIAACALEPHMTEAEAKELWDSDDWSRGDLMVLFREAVELNNRGLDVPFNAAG